MRANRQDRQPELRRLSETGMWERGLLSDFGRQPNAELRGNVWLIEYGLRIKARAVDSGIALSGRSDEPTLRSLTDRKGLLARESVSQEVSHLAVHPSF